MQLAIIFLKYLRIMRIICLFIFLIALSCKKEKPATVKTTSSTLTHSNFFGAKVNSQSWQAAEEGFETSRAAYYFLSGKTSNGNVLSSISFSLAATTTTGSILIDNTLLKAAYRDSSGLVYKAIGGEINLSLLDTFAHGIKRMKGSFTFTTETLGSNTYTVSAGGIDFKL
jgi:hypothetical protein